MSWVKITDTALDDPRLLVLDRGTRLLHLEALAYASRYVTGGFVPSHALVRLTDEPNPKAAAKALVAAGLWEEAKDEGGYQLVWLQDDQPTAEDVARKREIDAHRTRRKRQHDRGDHALCTDPRWCGWLRSQGATSRVSHDERHAADTRVTRSPDPTRPDLSQGQGRGPRRSARKAGGTPTAGAGETEVCFWCANPRREGQPPFLPVSDWKDGRGTTYGHPMSDWRDLTPEWQAWVDEHNDGDEYVCEDEPPGFASCENGCSGAFPEKSLSPAGRCVRCEARR